jgi:hypothetical protein
LRVFVLDKNHKPLMLCHPARARKLLAKGRAAVFRQAPFTIILKEREGGTCQALSLQLDPGSKITGVALVAHYCRLSQRTDGYSYTHLKQEQRFLLAINDGVSALSIR